MAPLSADFLEALGTDLAGAFLIDLSMVSLGMLAALALSINRRRVGLESGSPLALLAATVS